MPITVSIIVPIYNMEAYLSRCIDSIISQTYRNTEIILVDDGSKDQSSKICDEYENIDDRIHVLHKNNEGLVEARKSGLAVSKGKYVVYVDADDYISTTLVSEFIEIAREYGPDLIQCGTLIEYDDKEPTRFNDCVKEGLYFPKKDTVFASNYIFGSLGNKIGRLRSTVWSCMFVRELLNDIQMEVDGSITNGEDDACYYPYLLASDSYYYIDKLLYHHYERRQSMCMERSNYSVDDVRKIEDAIMPHVAGHPLSEMLKPSFEEYISERYFRHLYNMTGIYVNKVYALPLDIAPLGSRIIIYGYGRVGRDYIEQNEDFGAYAIVGICDSDASRADGRYIPLESIADEEFDYVIIAVYKEKMAEEIKRYLMKNGVAEEYIKWKKPRLSSAFNRICRERMG